MSSESITGESKSERDSWGRVFWFLAFSGTLVMLSYEYVWSRLALRNPATTSFGDWIGTGAALTTPWIFCLICVKQFREAAKNGTISRVICSEFSVWAELAMIAAYFFLAPAIHRLASLGAIR
jgi:hypothetical protein